MPRNPNTIPSKAWCFTLNNYTDDEYSSIQERLIRLSDYSCIGREVGTNGTPHLQGYFRLTQGLNLPAVKSEILNPRCHVEKARGSASVNRRYCTKDGLFVEHGVCPGRPNGKTRDEIANEFRANFNANPGDALSKFADDNPGVYYFSGHTLLRNHLRLERAPHRPDINVRWYYGAPGTGKSRRAHDELPDAYIKDPRTKWWNGYQLQRDVIIDDFGPNGIDINHLLRWFDRYRCYVEVKGDMVPLFAVKFIVTSNFEPAQIFVSFESVNPQLPALMRRIELVLIQ